MALLNIRQFQANLLNFAHNDVPQHLMRRQIEIAVHLTGILTGPPSAGGTPVDTGFAVSNWRMAVDTIPEGTLGTYQKAAERKLPYRANDPYRFKVKGWPRPPLAGRDRETLINTAFHRGQEFNMTQWKKIGHVIYVFNNVKYLQVLNNGHSQQAPAGFVERAIASTKAWMATKGW